MIDNDNLYEFLGKGWSFPPTFSKTSRSVKILENEENIAKSIKVIVLTRLGERFFHPNFGTEINDFAFMRNVISKDRIRLKRMIETAITENEYRVDVDQVDIQNNQQEGCVEISVAYTIKAFDTKYNMVFPFYLESGVGYLE